MIIKFKGKYKSLSTFESEQLGNFVIITGKNGSGKSQFVHCINKTFNSTGEKKEFELQMDPPPQSVFISDLIYKSNGLASSNTFHQQIELYINLFEGLPPFLQSFYAYFYDKDIHISEIEKLSFEDLKRITGQSDIREYIIRVLRMAEVAPSVPEEKILQRLINVTNGHLRLFDILLLIKNFKEKKFDEISDNDFYTTQIPEKYIDNSALFGSQIEMIFFSYLKRRHNNDWLNFHNQQHGERHKVVTDQEFERKYPAPWKIINGILERINLDLRVKEYAVTDYSDAMKMDVKFKRQGRPDFVQFAELSSGEQVILGLIIQLFTKDYYGGDLKFPNLIVLDEPDAYLHPEMSQLLINVLYNSFVNELGIKVIMTTHSPSTVALAPEDSIYEIKNFPDCSLKKVTKDYALQLLTGSIPTLSIDYKNHRQVFVESPTDVNYFQKLFNKLNTEERLLHKLYFLSANKGKGNNDWVKSIVNRLREAGANKIFGVIDWDTKNTSSEGILIHGENARYSIENFLYDAIYFAILLLELNGADGIRKELSIDETYNHYNLILASKERLQQIWNWYIAKIEEKFLALDSSKLTTIKYYNGIEVTIPIWYVSIKGHKLEEKLRRCFQSLQKFKNEGELQEKLSIIVAKCYPLIPQESIDTIKKLCQLSMSS